MKNAGQLKGRGLNLGQYLVAKFQTAQKLVPTVREHHSLRRLCADQTTATPQATEMQVEGKIGVEEAVKEMLEIKVEEDKGDPFEGMNNAQVAEIYYKMKPEDHHLFRQFKSFHKLHHDLHRHDAPSQHLARGIIREMFSGLPARDADTIANVRAELLVAERLKDLCKQLGLAVPDQLQTYRTPPEALEYPPPPPPLHFPSQQDQAKQVAQEQPQQPSAEVDTADTGREASQKAGHLVPWSARATKNAGSR